MERGFAFNLKQMHVLSANLGNTSFGGGLFTDVNIGSDGGGANNYWQGISMKF